MRSGHKGYTRGRVFSALVAVAVLASGLTAVDLAVAPTIAEAAIPDGWDAGNIVDDGAFFNGRSMSAADIQAFVNSKVSCAAGALCLANYTETTRDLPADPVCAAYTGAANETAATIIYKMAIACGVNAQVILVTLQKEQGLVTNANPEAIKWRKAMGAGCPDTSVCDSEYYGFFNQIHRGTFLFKRYTQPPGTGPGTPYYTDFAAMKPVGQYSDILYNVSSSCTQTNHIFIANQATHSLYLYTPYTPNQASLDAWAVGSGVVADGNPGKACASYGNRNFYGYYASWFGTGRGSVSGTLTGEGNVPLGDVWVKAYTQAGALAGSALTASNGSYKVTGLEPGNYTLQFPGSGDFVGEWFGDAANIGTATFFSVAQTDIQTGRSATLENPTFADVPDPWSSVYTYIEWMAAQGISTGTPQTGAKPLYKPSDSVSRQAMAQFLLRLSGEAYVPPADPTFADVPASSQFYTAIEWMAYKGISTGTPQSGAKPLYKPSDAVSRQAMAQFLARYAGADLSTPPTTQAFCDVPVDYPSAAAITWMADNGISSGTPNPTCNPDYKPSLPVSRSAMAAFLYRLDHLP